MLFESQRNSDEVTSTFQRMVLRPHFSKLAAVQAIHLISAKLFRCPRSALGLTCASRGKIFGPVYYTANGQYYDCRTFQAPAPARLSCADRPSWPTQIRGIAESKHCRGTAGTSRVGQRSGQVEIERLCTPAGGAANQLRVQRAYHLWAGISSTANGILVVEKDCAFQRCAYEMRLSTSCRVRLCAG